MEVGTISNSCVVPGRTEVSAVEIKSKPSWLSWVICDSWGMSVRHECDSWGMSDLCSKGLCERKSEDEAYRSSHVYTSCSR